MGPQRCNPHDLYGIQFVQCLLWAVTKALLITTTFLRLDSSSLHVNPDLLQIFGLVLYRSIP